jgi:hypothetical protein
VVASVLLLIPCFWQSRIQGGDLSSHIYNAWLAQLIESGKTTGLAVVSQKTNVLVDLMLAGLLRTMGADAAQRITVSLAVLVFAWGAFCFIWRFAGRRPWALFPVIAMLAYGWVFHMGFLNFYLSLGLCLFAVALAWPLKPAGLAAAAVLFAVAYVAHGLPIAWAGLLIVYGWIARRLPESALPSLLGISIGAVGALRLILDAATETRWNFEQALSAVGADQAVIYTTKYWATAAPVLLLWAVLIASVWRQDGTKRMLRSIPFHFAFLTAIGIVVLPNGLAISGYRQGITFIANRMSLPLGVCYCAVAARGRTTAFVRYVGVATMLLYFGLLYHDDAIFNRYEERLSAAVAGFRGQRVVVGLAQLTPRVDPTIHMVDRACLGVCYSYGNYEASTWQFRVRALAKNPFVIDNYLDSFLLQTGDYVVKPEDLPLYRADLDADGNWVVHPVAAGGAVGMDQRDLVR